MQGVGVRVQTKRVMLEGVDDILSASLMENPALEPADAKRGSNPAASNQFGNRQSSIVRIDVERILNVE
jgi:hypothetical protein